MKRRLGCRVYAFWQVATGKYSHGSVQCQRVYVCICEGTKFKYQAPPVKRTAHILMLIVTRTRDTACRKDEECGHKTIFSGLAKHTYTADPYRSNRVSWSPSRRKHSDAILGVSYRTPNIRYMQPMNGHILHLWNAALHKLEKPVDICAT